MIELIQEKLNDYTARNAVEEENAVKEILQEIALYSLWRSDFFDVALFQGGTSLRILHGLPRFSEDLDFMLRQPNPHFDWQHYLEPLLQTFSEFGIKSEALPRGNMDKRIRHAMIKSNSIASQLNLSFADRNPNRKLRIKLEIDIAPPPYSGEAQTFLDFPLDHRVRHQNLESNFALKIHALLCRGFLKGRDWYDFSWYVSKGVFPNLPHLQAALSQFGPWSEKQELNVDVDWVSRELDAAISRVDWSKAAQDVSRFLRTSEAKSLELWGVPFFVSKLNKLMASAPQP